MEAHTSQQMTKQLPRDVFLYLLMIFALGGSAISFGILLFQFINIYVVDVASDVCRFGGCHNAIRGSLAFLIVVFPVLLWSTRFLRRDLQRNPSKREMPVRRWLLYLTLFVAGLIVIGDLVALVNGYLQGELTTRFLLKVLGIFFIAGSMFYYYLQELHVSDSSLARTIGRVVMIVVAVFVVLGFIVAGSPTRQRDVRLDNERIQDLQVLQSQIVDRFWRGKGRLPTALAELEDDISGFQVPVDPETADPYEYERLGTLQFQLCATFTLASQEFDPVARKLEFGGNWDHKEGRVCFERTIDPDLRQLEDTPPVPRRIR